MIFLSVFRIKNFIYQKVKTEHTVAFFYFRQQNLQGQLYHLLNYWTPRENATNSSRCMNREHLFLVYERSSPIFRPILKILSYLISLVNFLMIALINL